MKIIELDKKEYKGFEIDCRYQTKAFFDVSVKKKKAILIKVKKKKLFKKKEKSFSATLFDEYIEAPRAFAVFDKKKIIGVIEGSKETWNNLYRIHNFNVEKKYRRQGIGKQLFDHMIENAKKEGCRAVILEVQSCNVPAIEFYMDRGLHFVGLNTLCYTNKDIENREVRLEMGMRF